MRPIPVPYNVNISNFNTNDRLDDFYVTIGQSLRCTISHFWIVQHALTLLHRSFFYLSIRFAHDFVQWVEFMYFRVVDTKIYHQVCLIETIHLNKNRSKAFGSILKIPKKRKHCIQIKSAFYIIRDGCSSCG